MYQLVYKAPLVDFHVAVFFVHQICICIAWSGEGREGELLELFADMRIIRTLTGCAFTFSITCSVYRKSGWCWETWLDVVYIYSFHNGFMYIAQACLRHLLIFEAKPRYS